jgi:hypothetical protein
MNSEKYPGIRFIFYFGIALMSSAIPLSKFFMSFAQFILAGVFLWDGIDQDKIVRVYRERKIISGIFRIIPVTFLEVARNVFRKFRMFFNNRPAIVFSSILLLFVIGLLYTSDFNYAFKDLRTKLPLFLLPLFISTTEALNKKGFMNIMLVYVLAVAGGSFYSTYLWLTSSLTDTRDISPFISHIRFGLNVCLAIFTLWYFVYTEKNPSLKGILKEKIPYLLFMTWLVVFLFILKSSTGIMAFFITLVFLFLFYASRQQRRLIRFGIPVVALILILLIISYVAITVRDYYHVEPVKIQQLDKYTPRGIPYLHDTAMGVENGRYTGLYLCVPELKETWNKRSLINYDSLDHKGQQLRYTLIRYLSSRDLRKDEDGVNALSEKEVRYIEDGVANINDLKRFNPKTIIYQNILAFQEYKQDKDVVGFSVLERIELWKAAFAQIKMHPLFGIGTGDLKISFHKQLIIMNSPLQNAKEGLYSSHNQFLNIMVLFGIVGLIWFMFALIYPAVKTGGFKDYFFLTFFIIGLVSMLTDDTLKTQAGVTFFSFFYAFFLFGRK